MKKNSGHQLLFELIAPIYGLFYAYQKRHYAEVVEGIKNELDLSAYENILDVGCGTGALSSVLHQKGLSVTGIDPAQKMLNIAAKKPENKEITFIRANALEKLPFTDKSFDVSIASYVAHGLQADERKAIYAEMNRITKHRVVIYDYNENRALLTSIIEWLEGGDYFNFIKHTKEEMKNSFRDVKEIHVGIRASWYICEPAE